MRFASLRHLRLCVFSLSRRTGEGWGEGRNHLKFNL